ncbi:MULTISPECIES: MarR family winged helix-turn-helix transcriptional regulator [unclassified Curtobacterium]|uniref:MarR family winged helix-turn-helix transcriptional regulator n=1 Tax=unclassified Curtobacterium TaxID=257496 RepID=UPI0008DD56F8|nr:MULTISPECIES: MarR family transcriptional regulator [unclassified Curtobacterium]OIH94181.1 MarR family transcriptional regulator [Curtobacterium sp. MCBA15_003]OII29323.1 MarR family transcriptional regulator [Curtobacterium sp. MMLR14_006]
MAVDLEALGLAVKQAQYRNHRAAEQALKDQIGVTLVQWDALRAIDRLPHTSGHDLAVATFQSDQAFGTLANRLVSRGLIARTAGRGRRLEHSLTDTGRASLEAGKRITRDVLADQFSRLDDTQQQELGDLLATLLAGE